MMARKYSAISRMPDWARRYLSGERRDDPTKSAMSSDQRFTASRSRRGTPSITMITLAGIG